MKSYWRSLEERQNPEQFKIDDARAEIDQKRDLMKKDAGSSRRDFLKTFGFSIAGAAVVASCKKPVEKAIPFLVKPEEVTPGMANYYASTYFEGNEYCSILVKVRDGRPIKIEGNDLSPVTRQGTSARVQASLLNLYDDARFRGPQKNGEPLPWTKIDAEITESLQQLDTSGKKVVLLTSSVISPSTRAIIEAFQKVYPRVWWLRYDAVSATGILKANQLSFGKAVIPDYHFDRAKVIVSFGADFLGTWLAPVEYAKKYAQGRDLTRQAEMSRHYQFEAGLSLTGANADVRFPVKPSEELLLLKQLYNRLCLSGGLPPAAGDGQSPVDLTALAEELTRHAGEALVVSGSNDYRLQLLVNAINHLLGNYGKTITFDRPLLTRQASDEEFALFLTALAAGEVGGVICHGVNPVYDHPEGEKIAALLKNLPLSVSFSDRIEETTAVCTYVCPEPHYLESWGDAEPKTGSFSLMQPAIRRLFDSRQPQESLMKWAGQEINYYEYLRQYWEKELFPKQALFDGFRQFWNDTLQKGVFELPAANSPLAWSETGLTEALEAAGPASQGWELVLTESVALGNGKFANNPWLQELPDPVAKISWDNFASVPVKWAEENGVTNESVITINGLELPVFVQPGQAPQTISVALGYGRTVAGKVGDNLGVNLYPLQPVENGVRKFFLTGVNVELTGKRYPLAISQTHHSMEGRPIVRETAFGAWKVNPAAGNELHAIHESKMVTLYEKKEFKGHHWGMAVDLNACIGCGNCAISCQAENNIQVVGKEQVRNRRIMHWIRIDRYFSEQPENPRVSFQPVMCQHCDNAPCENVCPVAATPHSDEGLNQMAYNRCVGTRYCINNCPYRVRRFNWFQFVNNEKFDYASNSDLGRMVLNPDVTVRSRGVVEKCSFCVQRIQDKKQLAKIEGRPLRDGEIQPACVQSCPSNALVFGDMNDPESKISKLMADPRNYHLLEELHTLPSVGYLTKVRNVAES